MDPLIAEFAGLAITLDRKIVDELLKPVINKELISELRLESDRLHRLEQERQDRLERERQDRLERERLDRDRQDRLDDEARAQFARDAGTV